MDLCHYRCHIFGKYAVHNNLDSMLYLKQMGQKKVMEEQGWDRKRFIREFGKDYEAIYMDHIRNMEGQDA